MKHTKEPIATLAAETGQIDAADVTLEVEPLAETKTQQVDPALLDPDQPIWKPLLVFLIPLMASNILQSLGGTVSSIIVGQGIGENALASINVVMPLIFFLISLVIGIGGASSVLIGQAFGANDIAQIKKVVNTSLKFSFFVGIILAILGVVFAPELLNMIHTPPAVIGNATQFARIVFAGLPLMFVYMIYTTFLRGTGDSKTPFYFLLLSTAINIIVAPILALGLWGLPAFSVKGIAVAMLLSNVIAMVTLFIYLKKKNHLLAVDRTLFNSLKMDPQILKLMIKIGLPSGIQMVFISLSEIAVIFLINSYGAQATAAYGAVIQVITYVQMPAMSLGMAIGIFGSQLIGARANHRLGALLKSGVLLNYVIGLVLVGITYLFSEQILALFLTESTTLAMAEEILLLVLWSYLLFGNSMVISGLMRSSGTVLWPTLIGIVAVWGVQVPVAYVLSKTMGLGLTGVWMAYPVAFAFSLIASYLYYRLQWKNKEHRNLFQEA